MKRNIFTFFFLFGSIFLFTNHLLGINKFIVTIKQPNPIKNPVIDWVTVSDNNKAQIAWKKQVNDNISYYNVYRSASSAGNDWELAGKVDYKSEAYLNDLNSFAQVQAYRYRISAVDQCNNEVFSNTIFKTIYLSVKLNGNNNLLNWNPSEGFLVNRYYIYKGETPQNLILKDSLGVSLSEYEDVEASNSIVYYQIKAIGVIEDGDLVQQPTKMSSNFIKSVSNIISNTYDSVINPFVNENLQIHPNPMISNALIKFPYDPTQEYKMYIYDMVGQIVYKQSVNNGEFILSHENLKPGMYILQISGRKSIQKRLIIGGN